MMFRSSRFFSAVPDPLSDDVKSLYETVLALKSNVEILTSQRKPYSDRAVVYQELEDLGLTSGVVTSLDLENGSGFFHVTRGGTNQTVSSSVDTKVEFTTEVADTNNWFDNATNYRFQPTNGEESTWLIVLSSYTTAGSSAQSKIYKNGSLSHVSTFVGELAASQCTAFVTFNGSTDYIEAFVASFATTLSGLAAGTYMQGLRVL